MDAAFARRENARAAAEEKEAIGGVTKALEEERRTLELRQQRDREAAKTDEEVAKAKFDLERAVLGNEVGLSHEDRARREADIDRRQLEDRQQRRKTNLDREYQDEFEKAEATARVVAEARKKRDAALAARHGTQDGTPMAHHGGERPQGRAGRLREGLGDR
ncbi:MAG: hypothetical protein QM784_27930 [Polyangiaceae bacterium]